MGTFSSKIKKRLSREIRLKASSEYQDDEDARGRAADSRRKGGRPLKRRSRMHMLSDQSIGEYEFDPDAEMVDMQSLVKRIIADPTSGSSGPHFRRSKVLRRPTLQEAGFMNELEDQLPGHASTVQDVAEENAMRMLPTEAEVGTSTLQPALIESCRDQASESNDGPREQLFASDAYVDVPPSPVLKPTRLPSIRDSVNSPRWRLSFHESRSNPSYASPNRGSNGVNSVLGEENVNMQPHHSSKASDMCDLDGTWTKPADEIQRPKHASLTVNAGRRAQAEMRNTSESGVSGPNIRSSQSSVHLYGMRISHHLRSPSTLSVAASHQGHTAWHRGNGTTHPDNATLRPVKSRHQHQTSSSGFDSIKLPASWGHALPDEASSIYSTRPNSPLKSPTTSMFDKVPPLPHSKPTNSDETQFTYDSSTDENQTLHQLSDDQVGKAAHAARLSEQSVLALGKKKAGNAMRLSALMSKSRSMNFGITALRSYARLIRSHSTEFIKLSHRTPTSIADEELNENTAPKTESSTLPKRARKKGLGPGIPEYPPGATPEHEASKAVRWSQLYQSCVDLPGVSDSLEPGADGDFSTARSTSAKSLPVNLHTPVRHDRTRSARSAQSVRASTVDFCKLLQEIEMKEKEKALGMAASAEEEEM